MDKEALKTLVRLGQEIEAQPPLPPLPEQEPVGYVYSEKGVKHGAIQTQRDLPNGTPLYAAPLPVQEPVLMQERRAKRMSGSVITEWSEWYASQYNTPEEAKADEFFAEHIPHEWRQLCVVPTTPPLPVQRQPLTDEQFNDLVMEHLGPHALTGGKMSVYDAFLKAVRATEAAHNIGVNK